MLTTVEAAKKQLDFFEDEEVDEEEIERLVMSVSAAIETYCRRDFSIDYTLPGDEGDKPRLPYDIEDACLLWIKYRDRMNAAIGVSSERIDGLGQKNYSLQHIEGKIIPAPPAVLALIDPYREMIYG